MCPYGTMPALPDTAPLRRGEPSKHRRLKDLLGHLEYLIRGIGPSPDDIAKDGMAAEIRWDPGGPPLAGPFFTHGEAYRPRPAIDGKVRGWPRSRRSG